MLSWPPAWLAAATRRAQISSSGAPTEKRFDERVGELAGEAVGAEQKEVAGSISSSKISGVHKVLRAESAGDDIARAENAELPRGPCGPGGLALRPVSGRG